MHRSAKKATGSREKYMVESQKWGYLTKSAGQPFGDSPART